MKFRLPRSDADDAVSKLDHGSFRRLINNHSNLSRDITDCGIPIDFFVAKMTCGSPVGKSGNENFLLVAMIWSMTIANS